VHARVRVERGELPAAANEFKLWLEDAASATAADGVVVALASMQYASTLMALSTGAGMAGGGSGVFKIVALLRSAEAALRAEAEASGMLSTEQWPCLVQPTPGGQGEASPVHIASLQNLYNRPLQGLVEAKLELAIGLQLTSSTTAGSSIDAAEQLLTDAASLAKRTLYPRPSLVARVYRELGRVRLQQAQLASSASWGGAGNAAPSEPGEEPAVVPIVEQAADALHRALAALADGEQVEPRFQAQICLELAVLHGSRLVPNDDLKQLSLAAAYVRHASTCSVARRALYADLPAAPISPLDATVPLPRPLDDEVTQAAALAALRPHTMAGSEGEGRSSRDLLWLASSLMRSRELPHVDQDAYEQKQHLLNDFLKKACKPFADALIPPPPPPHEMSVDAPAGLVCLQWHESAAALCGTTAEPTITLIYFLAGADGEAAEGAFTLGKLVLPRAGVLATSRLLQRHAALGTEAGEGAVQESLGAIRELVLPPAEVPASAPAPAGDDDGDSAEGEPAVQAPSAESTAAAAIDAGSLGALASMFDPLTGSTHTDEALCAWLRALLLAH